MTQTLSKLAHDLKPYIVAWINAAVAGGPSAGGGGGGGLSAHALDGFYHTGVIGNSQAPQFPLLAGGRTYTGSLVLLDGLTVDGVDLSEHAANPTAHHALATAGNTGISVAGQAVSLALAGTSGLQISSGLMVADAIAGAGLTIASKILAVGAGAGMTVNADDVALTTPGSLSNTTTNTAAGNHTHAVTASVDVGTTPVAALLKSTAAGGLILGTLGVKGAVDVTNGGQLYVAGGVGGASGIIVTLGDTPETARVGFARIPDPQFTVDVNGPLRADYLIGQHAIQLKDAMLIAHYDGGGAPETNYTGEPNGHRGQVATITGTLQYVPGLFGKAVRLAQATINLVGNPSFEVNVTDKWDQTNGASITRDATMAFVGSYSCKFAATTTLTQMRAYSVSVANGETITGQIRVYREFANDNIYVQLYNATDSATLVTANAALTDEWELIVVSWTNTTGVSKNVRLYFTRNDPTTSLGACWFDAAQLEIGPATPYIDGTMPGASWTASAHFSTTSASANAMTYSFAGNFPFAEGTIMAWVMLPRPANGGLRDIARAVSGSTYIGLRVDSNGNANAVWGTTTLGGGALTPGAWHHLALTSDGRTLRLYMDGAEQSNTTHDALSGVPSIFGVGSTGFSAEYLDGLVDDLVITSNAQTAEKILSIYESDAPVFAESSVFAFRATPTGLVWADENGLWMRDVAGNHVLGVYGGAAATHSWGGLSLEVGDLLIGRSPNGYVHWDNSLDTLSVSGQIIIQNPEDISYSTISGLPTNLAGINSAEGTKLGGIAAGATVGATWGTNLSGIPATLGTPAGSGLFLSATGMGYYTGGAFKTYIASTGQFYFNGPTGATIAWDGTDLKGTDGTTVQWYARASTGKLYVGAGAVRLDVDGLSIDVPTSYQKKNALSFDVLGTPISELYAISLAGSSNTYLTVTTAGNDNNLNLNSVVSTTTYRAAAVLKAEKSGGTQASVGAYTQSATTWINLDADKVYVKSTLEAMSAAGLTLQDDGGNTGLTVVDGGRVNVGNQAMNQRQTYSHHTAYGTAVASGGTIFSILGTATNYRYTLLRVTFTQHVATTNLNNHCAAVALINIGNHSGGLTAAVLSHELIKNRKVAVSIVGGGWTFKITDATDANIAVETYHSITVEMWGWYTGPSSGVAYPVFYP